MDPRLRKHIRENVASGADFTRLPFFSGSVTSSCDPNACWPMEEEVKAAIEESHRLGRMITARAYGGLGVDWGIDHGLDCVEHGIF